MRWSDLSSRFACTRCKEVRLTVETHGMTTYIENLFSLSGRTAVVTGASSGIGRHMAGVLARGGAAVVLLARREAELVGLSDEIPAAGGSVSFVATSLSGDMDFRGLADTLSLPFGPPDVLVNTAGVNLRQHADEVTPEGWHRTIDLNLTVPFFLAQALLPGDAGEGGMAATSSISRHFSRNAPLPTALLTARRRAVSSN